MDSVLFLLAIAGFLWLSFKSSHTYPGMGYVGSKILFAFAVLMLIIKYRLNFESDLFYVLQGAVLVSIFKDFYLFYTDKNKARTSIEDHQAEYSKKHDR